MTYQVDRGWAWVVLAASLGNNFLSGLLVYMVGVVHVELLEKYQGDVTTTAWAGAIYSSLQMLAAPLATWTVYNYGCRVSVIAGGILMCLGFAASAFARSVSVLLVTYSLMAGTGMGLTYSPTLMTIGFYFNRWRGLASGISVSGCAVGILCGSLITQTMINNYGLSGAFLMLGGIALQNAVFAMFFRPTPHEGRRLKQHKKLQIGSKVASLKNILDNSHVGESPVMKFPREKMSEEKPSKFSVCDENESVKAPTGERSEQKQCDLNACDGTTTTTHSIDQSGNLEITSGDESEVDKLLDDNCDRNILPDESASVHLPIHREEYCLQTQDRTENNKPVVDDHVKNRIPKPQAKNVASENGTDVLDEIHHVPCKTKTSSMPFWHNVRVSTAVWLQERWQGMRPLICNSSFVSHCLAVLVSNITMSGVYLHLPEYATTMGTDVTVAATLFVGVGIFSFVSRLVVGFLTTGSKINALYLSLSLMALCGAATGLFPLYSRTYVGQMAFACLFGLSTGGFYTLINVLTVDLVGFGDTLAKAYGLLVFVMGIGYVSGPPLVGIIVDSGGTYEHSFIFLGLTMFAAALLDLIAKLVQKTPNTELQGVLKVTVDVKSEKVTEALLSTKD